MALDSEEGKEWLSPSEDVDFFLGWHRKKAQTCFSATRRVVGYEQFA